MSILMNAALHASSWPGRTEVLEKLLEKGADVDFVGIDSTEGLTALTISMLNFDDGSFTEKSTIDILLDNGAVLSSEQSINWLMGKVFEAPYDWEHGLNYRSTQYVFEKLTKSGTDLGLPDWLLSIILGDSKTVLASLLDELSDFEKPIAILFASAFCDVDVLEALIEKGCDINTIDSDGYDLMKIAARYNSPEAIKFLEKNGLSFEHGDTMEDAENLSAYNTKFKTWSYISERKTALGMNTLGEDTIAAAATAGNLDVIMTAKDILLNDYETPELFRVVMSMSEHGNIECLKFIIDSGFDINTLHEGETLLSSTSNLDSAKWLLEHGADVNQGSPLYWAADGGNAELAKLLLEHGADINQNSSPDNDESGYVFPITAAIHSDNLEMVELLLKKGANVNETEPGEENTPLTLSAGIGSYTITSVLLENGAGAEHKNKSGETAYDIANKGEDAKLIALFD